MGRCIAEIIVGSAIYGLAIGSVHSRTQAGRNVIKFPLLIAATCLLCLVAYYLLAQLVTRRLSFMDVLRLSLRTFRAVSVLLASLGPVAFFLARTVVQPDAVCLNEYPLFLGLNVAFIAVAGTVALISEARGLMRRHRLKLRQSVAVVLVWLTVSLFVGGQCTWYMRPFFGPRSMKTLPFMEQSRPDYRGAASFYEAVYHLIDPPALPRGYHRRHEKEVKEAARRAPAGQ